MARKWKLSPWMWNQTKRQTNPVSQSYAYERGRESQHPWQVRAVECFWCNTAATQRDRTSSVFMRLESPPPLIPLFSYHIFFMRYCVSLHLNLYITLIFSFFKTNSIFHNYYIFNNSNLNKKSRKSILNAGKESRLYYVYNCQLVGFLFGK